MGWDTHQDGTYCFTIDGELLWEKDHTGVLEFAYDSNTIINYKYDPYITVGIANVIGIWKTQTGEILSSTIDISSLPVNSPQQLFTTKNNRMVIVSEYDDNTYIIENDLVTNRLVCFEAMNKKLNWERHPIIFDYETNILTFFADNKAHLFSIQEEE
jgi:hypothetical protein